MSKKITLLALLIALSVIGAAIKVPAIIGSVAFDVFPALIAAGILGGTAGAIVAVLGHLLSALLAGMPLGLLHGMIAVEMALLVVIFSFFYQKEKVWFAAILFVVGNSFFAPLPFLFILGNAFYFAMIPSLLIGSTLNMGIAWGLAPRLAGILSSGFVNRKESI
ncbi:ECF transporter S component [Mesobacillus maritimus]|uniref:ECF transporter S component n=1 Tax=Mesobacillus maritimus TaxID=1643336 RepID=UPI00203AE6E0|nr:ECF transporter S component [Mesobacillus maritimus]